MSLQIECTDLVKIFTAEGVEVQALQGLTLRVERGELTAIVGASGSGKSTLLSILTGLEIPTAGRAIVAGHDLLAMTSAQRTQARLNFYEVRRVPADEKRAKWEEYQALPAEERERLAGDRPKAPAGAAPALRPAPRSRVLRPTEAAGPGAVASSPAALRSAVPVNRNTLLPQPPASVASSTTR